LAFLSDDHESGSRRLDEALARAREVGDAALVAGVLFKVAVRHRQNGRYSDARDALAEVVERLRPDGNTRRLRVALYSTSDASRTLGRLDEAARGFREVLDLARADDDPAYIVSSRIALGVVALDAGDAARAGPILDEAAKAAARAGDSELEVHAHVLAGLALLRSGRLAEARRRLEESLDRARALSDDLELRALIYLADSERLASEHADAELRYRRAIQLAVELEMPEERWEALVGLAALHRARGEFDAAVREAGRAEALVEDLRGNVTGFGERTHFLQTRSEVYQILASSLAARRNGDLSEVFAVVERAHSRALREALESASAASPGTTPRLDEVQRRLAPDDLLVEYLLGEEHSLVLVVDRESASLHDLAPRPELDRLVVAYRDVLARPLTSVDARIDPEGDFRRLGAIGHELFRELLGDVAHRLPEVGRLIIVPDRQLHRLPFEALLLEPIAAETPIRFLGGHLSIQYVPSAAFIAAASPRETGRVAVVAADTGADSLALAPLRHAAAEMEGVAAAYPEDRRVLLRGADATLGRLREVGDVDVLHIAAHTTLQGGSGPRIVLGAGTGENSATIDVDGIASLAPSPRLVVLSMCESAEGELVGGEGILGLVRAFTLAGSRQVVASLWKVDDAESALLMSRFHRALGSGQPTSAALLTARRHALDEGFRHPFTWSGFVLYGAD
jgi:tetratricopeptide (TPR) repeat protein